MENRGINKLNSPLWGEIRNIDIVGIFPENSSNILYDVEHLKNRKSDIIHSVDISRIKFVVFFLILAFAFMLISNAFFGLEARVFPWSEKSFLGTDSPVAWKSAGYKISYPIKVVLIGPFNNIFHDDPPPPLVAAVFALYWSILALVLHYILSKIKHP